MTARKAKKKGARKAPKKKAPKTRTLTCKTPGCGTTWEEPIRSGHVREYCLERCSDPKNRSRDVGRLEDRGELERAAAAEAEREALELRLEEAAVPLRLAVALSLSDDRSLVAAVAGVDPDHRELEQMIARAKELFPDIVEGQPTALERLYQMAVAQAGVSALFGARTLRGSQAPGAMKAAMQAIAVAKSGGGARTFGKFEIVFREPGAGDTGGDENA